MKTEKPAAKKPESMTVTFTESVSVTDEKGEVVFSADRGESGPLPTASAERWIRRGKAVEGKVKLDEPEGDQDDSGTGNEQEGGEPATEQKAAPVKKAAKSKPGE